MRKNASFMPVLKTLLVLAILAIAGVLIYFLTRLPAPNEKNRVGTANGQFSIIRPPDWESAIKYAPVDKVYKTIVDLYPPKTIGKGDEIFLGELAEAPDLDKLRANGMKDKQFQGKPALINSGMVRERFVWRMLFERSGNWYELALWLEQETDVPNSRWWPYLESFQTGASLPTAAPLGPTPHSPAL